tara:strand:+ start:1900 stop:2499 length:600 start_codon:yes stop_codon:yes gene_type:complete
MKNKFIIISKISLLLVFLVIFAGSTVRMTGSGMGCPDWPKCFGYYIPPINKNKLLWKPNSHYNKNIMILYNGSFYNAKNEFKSTEKFEKNNWLKYTKHDYTEFNVTHTWFEYINRLLGVLAGFSVLFMFIFSFFLKSMKKVFIPLTSIILISIGFQAWLGKLVVDSNLAPYKISTHLLMAIIIVLLIVYNIKKTDEIKN